jgi:hypothetical protein
LFIRNAYKIEKQNKLFKIWGKCAVEIIIMKYVEDMAVVPIMEFQVREYLECLEVEKL